MSGSDVGSGSGAHAAEPGTLAVELAEGFADDDVAVLVDGTQLWHAAGVTTNYSVGIADVVRLPLPESAHPTVEVRVGRRSTAQQVDVAAAAGGGAADSGGSSGRAAEAGAGAGGELRLRARIDPAGSLTLGVASDEPRY